VPDRAAFNASVFVLVTGIAWRHLPREVDCSGVTAWRRLSDWQAAGVWERLHQTLLERLNKALAIDWSAAVVDGSHIRSLKPQAPVWGPPNEPQRQRVASLALRARYAPRLRYHPDPEPRPTWL
jgi:transposase